MSDIFADRSFIDKQPDKAECDKGIHKWLYETPYFRVCEACGIQESYENDKWVDCTEYPK